jgi:hypothetical protein
LGVFMDLYFVKWSNITILLDIWADYLDGLRDGAA